MTLLDRIMSRCIEEGECLIWQGACTCRIYVKDEETGAWVHKPVRRLLWEIRHGQPKPGHLIFPNCATPMCVGCIMSGTKKMHAARRKQLGLSAMRPDAIAKIVATKRARYGIPDAKILQAKQMLDAGALQATIARELGLSKASVSRIHLGQRYASVPGSSVFHQR